MIVEKMASNYPTYSEMAGLRLPSSRQGNRRCRTRFSPAQVETLEHVFSVTHYPTAELTEDIAQRTGLPETRIQIWFQNRRAKWRKHSRLMNFGGLEGVTETRYVPAPRAEDTVLSAADKNEDFPALREHLSSPALASRDGSTTYETNSTSGLIGSIQHPSPIMFSIPLPFFSPIVLFGQEKQQKEAQGLFMTSEDDNPSRHSSDVLKRIRKPPEGLDLSKRSCGKSHKVSAFDPIYSVAN